ncbi:MAG: imidazoleglycerol-phosphate dehydratase HisB [Candidatus Omnitrophota bacterium]
MPKKVTVKRKTKETDIQIALGLYGTGKYQIKTGISFLDHMLDLFAKHGLFDLKIFAKGDLDVDFHHTNEDVAIALGEAFSKALGNRAGIKRFGEATIPMDEAQARVIVDISGRPFLSFPGAGATGPGETGAYHLDYAVQFFKAFSDNCKATIHVEIVRSGDSHHVIEAVFKAFAKALLRAVEKEPRAKGVPSTKGRI